MVGLMWTFDSSGPDTSRLQGPKPLARRRLGLPKSPGLYLITCGDCLAHVGTSARLAGRVGSLARLGIHRGSSEVLCAAFCSREPPQVWWQECSTVSLAKEQERAFKNHYGEPPVPRPKYDPCRNGAHLKQRLIEIAGGRSWEAGYIEAVFAIGEKLQLLFAPQFQPIWERVGIPPGPWGDFFPTRANG